MTYGKNERFKFEILTAAPDDPMLAAGAYYVTIRDRAGTPLIDTCLSHRFSSVPDAQDFCRRIEDGTLPVHQVINESIQRIQQQVEDRKVVGKMEFERFLSDTQEFGVSPDTLRSILEAYSQLSADARALLKDEQAIRSFMKEHPMPNNDRMTFGAWMEVSKTDVDVCLVDADTGEHYLNAVCYLSEDDRRDPDLQYSDLEQWLFTLPLDKVVTGEFGCQLAIPRTGYSCDQTNFLLADAEYGFDSQEWANLDDRAHFADADFKARLAFLEKDTPFETPFDRDSMDAASPADRQALCRFLDMHPATFVSSYDQNGLMVAYSVLPRPSGGVWFEDCPVCVVNTEPGKGLSASLDGIVSNAQQKVGQQSEPSISQHFRETERM